MKEQAAPWRALDRIVQDIGQRNSDTDRDELQCIADEAVREVAERFAKRMGNPQPHCDI